MKKYKFILLITALSQFVSPYITSFSGGSNFSELLITPAGYTFAIWGAITLFAFIHSVYHAFFEKAVYSKKFYIFLSTVYVLFTVWLLVAERNMLPATVFVIFFMLYLVHNVFKEVLGKANLNDKWNKVFLQGAVGMYVGWLTIASVANIGAMLAYYGMDNYSTTGQVLQGGLVLLATVSAIFALKKFKNNIVLFGTFWWAFVGILIGLLSRAGTTNLVIFTVLCVIGLNVFYYKNSTN